jgi:peroxiredoxin (alkyl hydroperoxide reductase subunit C)
VPVTVRKPAPDFDEEAYLRGNAGPTRVRLADYQGKWIVLFFYPRDFTFVCPTEIQAFASLNKEFEAERAAVIGASTDSYFCHKAWYESDKRLADVTYPIIADTSHRMSLAFDVLQENGAALRGTFIIDTDSVVRHVQINDEDVGRNVEETLRLLRALRTGERCPVGWAPGKATLGR